MPANIIKREKEIKSVWFAPQFSSTYGEYRVRNIGVDGAWNFTFGIPIETSEIVNILFYAINDSGSSGNQTFIFNTTYGAIGERGDNHSESGISVTVDIQNNINIYSTSIYKSDAGGLLFANLNAGDMAGVEVDLPAGISSRALGIMVRYKA